MKVLFLTNIPSPYRVDFFEELGKLCELTVLYERKTADNRNAKWLNKKGRSFKEVFLSGIKVGNDSALCFSVISWLRKEYDFIVIGGYSTPTGMLAIEYLSLKKIPFVLNSDGGIIKNDSWIKYKVKKYFISKAMAWLSTGDNTSDYLMHYGASVENTYIYPFTSLKEDDILVNPISIEEKLELRKKLNMKEDKIIISIGRFIYVKGFDVLLNASTNLSKDIGVYIIGGEATEEYLELKDKLNLTNVHFKNFMSKEEIADYYKASDLFVLPTRGDVWGLVINEAMAYGLPVITTDKCIAGLELVIDYENGFIVPVDDEEVLVIRINEIIDDEKLLIKISEQNLIKVRNYTLENMAEENVKIFNEIMNYKKQF